MLSLQNNTKIGVCFYGFMRTVQQTITSIREHLLEPYNPDIFVSTYENYFSYSNQDPFNSQTNPDYVIEEDLRNLFGDRLKSFEIKKHDIQHYKNEVENNGLPNANFMGALTFRTFSLMDSIRRVLFLRKEYEKQNNIKYDIVILMRPDLILATKVKLEALDLDKVWGSIAHQAPVYSTAPLRLFGDHLLVSKTNNIDIFTTLYDQIAPLIKKGWLPNNETLLAAHLLENNIEFDKSDFTYHGIVR